jgi:hypothetical protein
MWRTLVIGFLCGAIAVPLFHEGTNFLLFHNHFWLRMTLGVPEGLRPPSPGFSLRFAPPIGLPELLNLLFWGGSWGVLLGFVLWLLRPPVLLTGFLFGALVCTGFGFAPYYGEQGLPIWNVIYVWNWVRVALVNGAWGWGAAAMMQAAGLEARLRR